MVGHRSHFLFLVTQGSKVRVEQLLVCLFTPTVCEAVHVATKRGSAGEWESDTEGDICCMDVCVGVKLLPWETLVDGILLVSCDVNTHSVVAADVSRCP